MNSAVFPVLYFQSEAATADWACRFAPLVRTGETLLLSGEIGAGKSAFARAFIRARLGRFEDIPSPTFTLVQTYRDPQDVEIWHCDLYRLTHPDEAYELGLQEAFETAICLIEWPDRLGNDVPNGALHLTFEARANDHQMTLAVPPHWQDRIADLT